MEEKPEIPESNEPTKEELERQKILLEIKDLKKEWWKKPAYIGAAFPTLLASLSLLYGVASGYFQASFVKLENQKYDLKREVDSFEQQKLKVQQELKDVKTELEKVTKDIENTENSKNYMAMRAHVAETRARELSEENVRLKQEIQRLQKSK